MFLVTHLFNTNFQYMQSTRRVYSSWKTKFYSTNLSCKQVFNKNVKICLARLQNWSYLIYLISIVWLTVRIYMEHSSHKPNNKIMSRLWWSPLSKANPDLHLKHNVFLFILSIVFFFFQIILNNKLTYNSVYSSHEFCFRVKWIDWSL